MNSQLDPAAYCHQSVVTLDNLSFAYENKRVIENLSFDILERDFVGIVGSNGAGKTTLLKMIVGLLKPDQGQIKLFGQPRGQFKDWQRIGYVPQKNSFNPLFPATVREVVQSGLYNRKNMLRRLAKADRHKCEEALEVMRIEDLAERRIGQLSGGQQQRVFLARALINNPDLLVLDEPTVGIDAETQASFFRLIRHLHQQHNMTFLMVSHDIDMLEDYIGTEPTRTVGKVKFYVRHTHEKQDCGKAGLTHSLRDLRQTLDVL